MSTQPEALRLAECLEAFEGVNYDAAAELRRLHEENNALRRERDEARRTVRDAHEAGTRLTAQRDALLEVLKQAMEDGVSIVYDHEDDETGTRGCCGELSYKPHSDNCWVTKARAVIAKAEGK